MFLQVAETYGPEAMLILYIVLVVFVFAVGLAVWRQNRK